MHLTRIPLPLASIHWFPAGTSASPGVVCRKMTLRYCHVCKQYYLCGNKYSVSVPLRTLLYEHPLNITLQNISIKMGVLIRKDNMFQEEKL